jgi:hypothetical protein
MNWKKLGVIIPPNKEIPWMAEYAGPSFVRILNNRILVYVSGRDTQNISRVGIVEISLQHEFCEIIKIELEPCLDIGELGLFDENGASYPWLIEQDGRILMYYVGWVNGGRSRFQNYTGLAISNDNGYTFHRIKKTPILDRTDEEPFGSGSCCVFREDNTWIMYYTAFEPWVDKKTYIRPTYNVKKAYSKDGIIWERSQEIVLNFTNKDEYVIGKPMLIRDNDCYKLWVSCRGESYRIGYAESYDNGITYIRKDDKVGIDVSKVGWDSESIEYAYVFDYQANRYMIYNGNSYGKTGIGLAILTS